jgi:hypothetical protein
MLRKLRKSDSDLKNGMLHGAYVHILWIHVEGICAYVYVPQFPIPIALRY